LIAQKRGNIEFQIDQSNLAKLSGLPNAACTSRPPLYQMRKRRNYGDCVSLTVTSVNALATLLQAFFLADTHTNTDRKALL